jgi:hypothetical protein
MSGKDNKESVNHNFKEAKEFVKKWYDLDLTLIEQKDLKEIVGHTTSLYIQDKEEYGAKYDRQTIRPSLEAMYIFMNKNYDAEIKDYGTLYEHNFKRNRDERNLGYDLTSEEFKIIQDRMHLP